mmetsp:Transcript_47985/g.138181  ORF Transcript_47985/g.138181 Transcript_47985/m.138181 type:complete len:542 (-) Transcript_47985:51-1676(-)
MNSSSKSSFELEERFKRLLTRPTDEIETKHRIWEDAGLDNLTQKDLDVLVAKDMNALTHTDREEILQELHGVGDAIEETPEFILQHRLLLDAELSTLASRWSSKTGAFERARQQNFAYVSSEDFQLMFLRATKWDVKDAATRMTAFFETKEQLFGTSKLTQRIEMSDLSKEDRKTLESGFIQLLPVRDSAGRAVLAVMIPLITYKEIENLKRAYFYLNMVALEDVETQRKGMISVGFNMGQSRRVDRRAVFSLHTTHSVLPLRLASAHYSFDDLTLRVMLAFFMLLANVAMRVRIRSHYGDPKSVLYQLSTYGIPVSSLPIADDGESKSKYHRQWVKLRAEEERQRNFGRLVGASLVVIPGRLDVLLGRGKPIQEHIGNLRYLALLDTYQYEYQILKKFEKQALCDRIVDMVEGYGGRFLKQEYAGWVRVDHVVARDKVAHALRTRIAISASGKADAPQETMGSNSKLSPKDEASGRVHPSLSEKPSTRSTESLALTDPPSPQPNLAKSTELLGSNKWNDETPAAEHKLKRQKNEEYGRMD